MTQRRLQFASSSQAMLLDAYYAETFVIWLRGNVTSIQLKNVTPGRLYVFIVKTDSRGGHTISWGSQIQNGTAINSIPNSVTVLCFIGVTGGLLMANAPGTWA